MSIQLRPFQQDLSLMIDLAWALGQNNVLAVLPTGGGKTVLFSHKIMQEAGPCCAIAHRKELVSQISLALARNGVRHRIIGPAEVARTCTRQHLDEGVGNHIDSQSQVAVAGVDTLIRMDVKDPWFRSVKLVVQDEAHHVLKENKWGNAYSMFPYARHLGVTATPLRADGKGLGAKMDGIFDEMIVGPSMRELINQGYLCDYRIAAPRTSNLDLESVPITAQGDYSQRPLAKAMKQSTIVGDVVGHYLRLAGGKRGVTFAVDVEEAADIAKAYRAAGVPAEVVSAETEASLRTRYVRQLRSGELLQLVNVDLFGEGFDLPAIEVVSFARPTRSYALYAQQFGRVLRTAPGKPYGLIIDHVDNVKLHGLPDSPRKWTLDRRDKRASTNTTSTIAVRVCPNATCALVYERVHRSCPYCGHTPEPVGRSDPKYVDGDLELLDEETLARMRGIIDIGPRYHPNPVVQSVNRVRWDNNQKAQGRLREKMAKWGGMRTHLGDTLAQAQRRFYLTYGIDVLSAQALTATQADELCERIEL